VELAFDRALRYEADPARPIEDDEDRSWAKSRALIDEAFLTPRDAKDRSQEKAEQMLSTRVDQAADTLFLPLRKHLGLDERATR
jgi:hypothetical protein